jgi:predicted nucleic-acid-binding protein
VLTSGGAMRAVDTNVLVRLVVGDDARQAQAAEAFVRRGAWVSQLVLAEATWVLESVYELGAEQLAVAIEMLLNHQALTVQDSDTVARALALFLDRPALGFSDCLVLEIARTAGHLPLGTFDRDLATRDGAARIDVRTAP